MYKNTDLTLLKVVKIQVRISIPVLKSTITLYFIITPLKYHIFENIMENGAFAKMEHLLKNAPFSIIFSKVLKNLLKFFLIFFFQCCLKNRK